MMEESFNEFYHNIEHLTIIHVYHILVHLLFITVQYKTLEGENFGKLQEIPQNFLVQNFPFYKVLGN